MQPPAEPAGPKSETPARDKMMKGLREKAGIKTETPKAAPQWEGTLEKPAPETISPTTAEVKPELPTGEQPGAETPAVPGKLADKTKEKANPWKLVDEYKSRSATLEKEILDLKKSLVPEQDRKTYEERAQRLEARNKELEDEIRYVNFTKSKQYLDEYQAPYEDAFKRAMSDLSEITVQDITTQQVRPATPEDFLAIVNAPLGEARSRAEAMFGNLANDVMVHRNEVRTLWNKQQAALKDAKENGSKREAEQQQMTQAQTEKLSREIRQMWDQENKTIVEHPEYGKYFTPREGNEEYNKRLDAGFKLVDQAFSQSPADPRLTPDQRATVIKMHTALRNRAAAWGVANWEKEQALARVVELEKELKAYKETTPPTAGSEPSSQPSVPGSAKERMFGELRKLAKPA
jgi:hypothetical protein